jgi:hypothetical protein
MIILVELEKTRHARQSNYDMPAAPQFAQPQAVTIEVVVDIDQESSPTSSAHETEMREEKVMFRSGSMV